MKQKKRRSFGQEWNFLESVVHLCTVLETIQLSNLIPSLPCLHGG